MSIVAVSVANAASNTLTLPSHRQGDLIYLAAVGQNNAPVAPNNQNWRFLVTSGSTGLYLNLFCKEALSTQEQCGTFTNAYALCAITYRSDAGLGLGSENWGSRQQTTADYRMPVFTPVNRQNHDATAFTPMMRINAVAINSVSANLNSNVPAGWTVKNNFSVTTPTPTRIGFLESNYIGGTFTSFDVVHGAGVVANRSIGTACYETYYPARIGRAHLGGYIGNGKAVF